MSNSDTAEPPEKNSVDSNSSRNDRKPYSPPSILSAEPLEAAAVVCDPPTLGFGKTTPPICTTNGS